DRFRPVQVPACKPTPFVALPVGAVDIENSAPPERLQGTDHGSVADAHADDGGVLRQPQRAQCTVTQGFEMLLVDCRQVFELHSAVCSQALWIVACPAEDGDRVTSVDHPPPDLLHTRLKSAVAGGHTASADECDMHCGVRDYCPAPSESGWLTARDSDSDRCA